MWYLFFQTLTHPATSCFLTPIPEILWLQSWRCGHFLDESEKQEILLFTNQAFFCVSKRSVLESITVPSLSLFPFLALFLLIPFVCVERSVCTHKRVCKSFYFVTLCVKFALAKQMQCQREFLKNKNNTLKSEGIRKREFFFLSKFLIPTIS